MSLSESILVAIFTMAVVFAVLGLLWGVIRLFSLFIQMIEGKNQKRST